MLGSALSFVAQRLNADLQRRFGTKRDLLVLAPLVANDGTPTSTVQNAVVLTMTNVSQETVIRNRKVSTLEGDSVIRARPPTEVNLHVMFSAGLKNYIEGLSLLSEVIARLKDVSVFDSASSPGLPEGLQRLAFSMLNLTYAEQSHLWGGLGAKYVPSVLYEVRMIGLGGQQLDAIVPAIASANVSGRALV